jgi:hypothetical protein
MNQFAGDNPSAVDDPHESSTREPHWAKRRRKLRENLYASEWLLATALYLMFAVLAATTLLV